MGSSSLAQKSPIVEGAASGLAASGLAATVLGDWTRAAMAEVATPALLRERLERAGERMPYELALEAWRHVELHDPDFGVRFAERLSLRDLGIVGYLAASSETVADAVQRAVRYHVLLKSPSEVSAGFTDEGDLVVREMPPRGLVWPGPLAEAILASYVALARQLGSTELVPLRARFVHRRAVTPTLEGLLGPRIELGCTVNELVLRGADARALLGTRDPKLLRFLEPVADQQVQAILEEDPFLRAVGEAITHALPDGPPEIGVVARRMGLSGRTLQRRLRDRGLRYQALVDDLRRRRALALLSRETRSIDEVAFLVGFSDASGFRRAFRRWTGAPPSDSRTGSTGDVE